jgi:type II secretory pathway pseudopilin PulG
VTKLLTLWLTLRLFRALVPIVAIVILTLLLTVASSRLARPDARRIAQDRRAAHSLLHDRQHTLELGLGR